jgi:hypothetical protein
METVSVSGLTLYFDDSEREAAEIIRQACERSVQLIHECWGLETPEDCRVYVMTSWLHFIFRSAPWPWKVQAAILFPLWSIRAKKMWRYAGGFHQRYGRRSAVGVKPPQLMALSDSSIGERFFVQGIDIVDKVGHTTCHELVHAFTSYLRLPMWLNEGLAQVTVDRFAGRPTIRPETIAVLEQPSGDTGPGRYRNLRAGDEDPLVYHFVRGYWLTRYIDDTQPDLMRRLLSRRYRHAELEGTIAGALGMAPEEFWDGIDPVLVAHFGK